MVEKIWHACFIALREVPCLHAIERMELSGICMVVHKWQPANYLQWAQKKTTSRRALFRLVTFSNLSRVASAYFRASVPKQDYASSMIRCERVSAQRPTLGECFGFIINEAPITCGNKHEQGNIGRKRNL